jgi:hypothetical protein
LYSESNAALSDKYKDLVVKNYPETPFAKTILDPDYGKRINDEDTGFSTVYTIRYMICMLQGNIRRLSALPMRCLHNILITGLRAIYYLRAFAAGHQEPLAPFNTDLQQIVSKYPDDRLITPLVNQHLAISQQTRPNSPPAAL